MQFHQNGGKHVSLYGGDIRAVNYLINIPARPFLPITPDGQLIPPAMEAVNRVLVSKFVKK
ncbi:hypothetical protein LU631_18840 [Erwinia tracheiphila]|uniref:Uncharacterized protein n=1 Tax=Erwinia tracheiphila TaxID=65700 RepID=A0A0M2KDX8_9GAMM|nr:hypothetical protein [Erwinia tracheiphila]AXF76478.1 hypothetical protein AV903_11205 [Erwinia tracheiphila]EOS96224.1 hypothetical protein ETR_04034 [Erwinia tracheiphila PSU-1]KKF35216.1 hypothetical protein SY86_06915 [Erwinia tracheiphila]UIA86874.1 hypothetical protein LU631_18840 [Erwinia tracheiphila]